MSSDETSGPLRIRLPGSGNALRVRATQRLAASWARSEDYGVGLHAVEPAFSGSIDTDSLFSECGTTVLRGLHSTLAGEPISLMVADREGVVLIRLCTDPAILRSLDRVHLAPGFSYSERAVGTNGLGLSLADRVPTLVRAEEHFCMALRGYTCAAAPVVDPRSGELVGTINLTTWSRSSSELLLALAQSAAGTTSALMQVRGGGQTRPAPRGEVYHVVAHRADDEDACTSGSWRAAMRQVVDGLAAGHVLAVVGEHGAGRATALSLARRQIVARERIVTARVPRPEDVGEWLASWTPELGRPDTCMLISGADALPAWAADDLAGRLRAVRRPREPQPFALTAGSYDDLPDRLAVLIDAVVEIPPLRLRSGDVMPLAMTFAQRERHRPVGFTPAAARALTSYAWPGNARQLRQVVQAAAARTDVVDTHHLNPQIFVSSGGTLSRLEVLERDELIRCLTSPKATVAEAAAELGMSRATVYRKIARYGIRLPSR